MSPVLCEQEYCGYFLRGCMQRCSLEEWKLLILTVKWLSEWLTDWLIDWLKAQIYLRQNRKWCVHADKMASLRPKRCGTLGPHRVKRELKVLLQGLSAKHKRGEKRSNTVSVFLWRPQCPQSKRMVWHLCVHPCVLFNNKVIPLSY